MKRVILLFSVLLLLLSCDKNDKAIYNLKLTETIPGGCAVDETQSRKLLQDDAVNYSIIDNELVLTVGFNATCCGKYDASSYVQNDTIFVDIVNTKLGLCNCICYYTYDFKYTGFSTGYNYKVSVDNYIFFNGEIDN